MSFTHARARGVSEGFETGTSRGQWMDGWTVVLSTQHFDVGGTLHTLSPFNLGLKNSENRSRDNLRHFYDVMQR